MSNGLFQNFSDETTFASWEKVVIFDLADGLIIGLICPLASRDLLLGGN